MRQICYCNNEMVYQPNQYQTSFNSYHGGYVSACPAKHSVINDTSADITVYWANAGPTVAFSKCMVGGIPGVCHSSTVSPGNTSEEFGFPETNVCATVIDYPFVIVNQGDNYCAKWVGIASSGVTKVLSAKKILDPNYATKCLTSQDAVDAIKKLLGTK